MAEYYEDVAIGDTVETGSYVVDEDEIVEFGRKYDPQPMHTDPEAAAGSMFGGLVASGWHTGALTMRLLVEDYFESTRALGAIGIDELRFPAPVRPGDELSVSSEVVGKEPWDDERGLVKNEVVTTAGDRSVLSMVGRVLWERR
jgi:acyl dehydratase